MSHGKATCPYCDAPLAFEIEVMLARGVIACAHCQQETDLDGARVSERERERARRTFRSNSLQPRQVRRYRVAILPFLEGPPPVDPSGRVSPLVAVLPALGSPPFGVGDTPEAALESLRLAVAAFLVRDRPSLELPPSDANAQDPWLPVEA